MSKELTPLEALKELRSFCGDVYYQQIYDKDYEIIETALKNYEELTSKPVILYGRTNGHTKALIDMISKNYKEVKITNLDDEKKVKAFEIIKEKQVNVQNFKNACSTMSYDQYLFMWKDGCFMGIMLTSKTMLTQEEYDLLKEVLKDE